MAGDERATRTLKNSKKTKIDKVTDKNLAATGIKELKVKSDFRTDGVGGSLVTAAFKDLPTPQENFAARLPAGFVWPEKLDASNMEIFLTQMADPVLRLRVEGCWLDLAQSQLDCGLAIISLRRGLILLAIKAETPAGGFEKAAKMFYPRLSERTARDSMARALLFLKNTEPTFSVGKGDHQKNYVAYRQKWTVMRILEFERHKTEKSVPEVTDGGKGSEGGGNSHALKKIQRSPFVRIETFSTQVRRTKKAFEKTLSNTKRLNPTDFQKALVLIERILPEEIRPYFAVILESSPKTPANQGGQS